MSKHLALVEITYEQLHRMSFEGGLTICESCVPKDAKLVSVDRDLGRCIIILVVEHESFCEVMPGASMPRIPFHVRHFSEDKS